MKVLILLLIIPGNPQARGVQNGMPNRLEKFASTKQNDPYRLDEQGYPRDHVTEEALHFFTENKKSPMFLYLCELVGSHSHTN